MALKCGLGAAKITVNIKAVSYSIVIVLLLATLGCYRSGTFGSSSYTETTYAGKSSGRYDQTTPLSKPPEPQPSDKARVQRLPWEGWPLDRDLLGQPITVRGILLGDQYTRVGQRVQALAEYQKANRLKLSPTEQEALVLRIASTELALDRPKESLSTLSSYFSSKGLNSDQVDLRFALVFAYAFGRDKNLDQSLAWFSRVSRMAAGRGGEHQAAVSGAGLLLRSLPDTQIYTLGEKWSSDVFVYTVIGQELKRRAGSSPAAANTATGKFWEGPSPATSPESSPRAISTPSGAGQVGVLLPLSGPYAPLGEKVKNGVVLAFESQAAGLGMQLAFRDTAANSGQAVMALRELMAAGALRAVIGPLLAGPAEAAGQVARENGVPLLALSKKSHFPVGDGVFRLGPTVKSQVSSLLEECYRKLGLVRYAVVYADDQNGLEYHAAFKQKAAELGLEVVFEKSYLPAATAGFSGIIAELEQQRAEAVFFTDSAQNVARFALELPERLRSGIKLLGTSRWDDQAQLRMSQKALDGAIFASPFFAKSTQPLTVQFEGAYRYKFGRAPDFMAAQGFDAGAIVAAALKRAQEQNTPFPAAMRSIDLYQGLTGKIRVGPTGELTRHLTVVQFKNGTLEELSEQERPSFIMRGNEAH
ncbi:MAG: penicillin-binding protein activator [Deltaproteobacteria bacterium]|nr:penicillin-binding protein activator [Deltaproteobacteria bacterium]